MSTLSCLRIQDSSYLNRNLTLEVGGVDKSYSLSPFSCVKEVRRLKCVSMKIRGGGWAKVGVIRCKVTTGQTGLTQTE